MNVAVVDSGAALRELLLGRGQRPVRLLGAGSRRARTPPAPAGALAVSLRGLDRIERLEPDDLTCSVGPGIGCAALQAELAGKGLDLGIDAGSDGAGTIGGLFAADPVTAAGPGAPTPRSTLLGVEGVLGEGKAFKAGARVVKSVAGFDVHKLFVGSRGLLFAATLLHLKLRPRAPAGVDFTTEPADAAAAVLRFLALRQLAPPPVRLTLAVHGAGGRVTGRCAGRAGHVAATLRAHGLREAGADVPRLCAASAGREVVDGLVRPSRVAALLALLPVDATAVIHGTGRFELELTRAATDALLEALPGLGAEAAILEGADDRRGLGTPRDPVACRLERDLQQALDPAGVWV